MPRGFVFHKRRGTRFRKIARKRDKPEVTVVEPPIQDVQGKKVGSVQEWRVAYCLMVHLRVPFIYQKPVSGGRVRGGQVVDFWVETKPLPTPVYVNGDYWHHGLKAIEDDLKVQSLIREYRGQINMPVILWEHTLPTMDATLTMLREYVV